MADHTTRKTTTDKLEEAITRLSTCQSTLTDKYVELSDKVDTILDHLRLKETTQNPPPPNSQFNQRNPVKLDIPRYDGRDPLGWIFKISQLFKYQNTPEEERITVASFYLDGVALSWYQWMFRNGFIMSWSGFLQALESRFAPTFYDDPKGALFKLTQRGNVNEYLTEFERLANQVIGLPPPFLLSCFISGLMPEIRWEVLALQPISLPQAIALAKLQEDKLRDRSVATHPNLPPSSSTSRSNSLAQSSSFPPSSSHQRSKPPFVQSTPEEMAFRREKGLCYNCDDKWNPGHRCKGGILLLITDNPVTEEETHEASLDSMTTSEEVLLDQSQLISDDPHPHISLHALSGLPSSDTFRLSGIIKHARITVLIDSGSTHNFLQPRIAQFLHLPTQKTSPLQVHVGNGSVLDCNQVCPNTQLSIQGNSFDVTFHLLLISGADAVLGIAWLKQLGPIITDYTSFVMRFNHLGQAVELHADIAIGPEAASTTQVKRLIRTGSTSALLHLRILPTHQTKPPTTHLLHPISAINTLLSRYQKLFQTPNHLPPPRDVVHCINIHPATAPVNVRPYRYPHFQKTEIEKQVSNLLSAGLIRPSTSPYSSPVLLVKKKDGTWRLCVDFRSLNAVTVRDRFPIPTIDELLDELGQASWFSKLDLRQGFHQILMHELDIEKTVFCAHHGHYEYLVMPFGLCNAPSTFQAAMNSLLTPFLCRFATVFFDDILVYSDSLPSHILHLEAILQTLLQGQYYLKQAKCLFA
ncbi:uncharacterized protein [Glycine max]|uniref:uncharacterized protein n=1 Tax=Glycine max TaxID=3847 RepID=UPI0003DEAD6B|nr:uncharacterized protein LOC102661323 [Glycine max]|eukprot:XP_006582748.1 uncharacterized protein LOC102661323 [Glycine max]